MEYKNELEGYCKEYKNLTTLLKVDENSLEGIKENLRKTRAGSFFLSLNENQRVEFSTIYKDSNIDNYILKEESIKKEKEEKRQLIQKILSCQEFPFSKDDEHIFIKSGNELYNAVTAESTESIKNDDIKKVIIDVVGESYSISKFNYFDIPLIKVLYERYKRYNQTENSKELELIIIEKASQILYNEKKEEKRTPLIPDEEYNKLKEELFTNITHLENGNNTFTPENNKLAEEMLYTPKSEIELLHGKSIEELIDYTRSSVTKDNYEREITYLAKACYNLTNQNFVYDCTYPNTFDLWNKTDMFETSNRVINQKILEMKKR